VSQAWKELVKAICEDPEAQDALRRACIERPELLFKAAEHAYGKPRQAVEVRGNPLYLMPNGEDIEGLDDGPEAA
jgi:hypothetical protein